MTVQWQLPGYTVDRLLGFGPTGDVWQARHLASGELVVLKRVALRDPAAESSLRRAAAALRSIEADPAAGSHVVRLRDVVVDAAGVVLVGDRADGGSLRDLLDQRSRLTAPEVVTVLAPLAATLGAAHARGIVHGHVSASNVLFAADARPMLADFGLARLRGETTSERDDVRALASVGYAALTGRDPSAARTSAAATAVPAVAHRLVAVIEDVVFASPSARLDARSFADAVLSSGAAAPVRMAASPPPSAGIGLTGMDGTRPAHRSRHRAPRPRRRVPVRFAVPAAVGVTLAVVAGTAWGGHGDDAPARLPQADVAAVAPRRADVATASPRWFDVVSRLDATRAAAFRTADPRLLTTVYAPGSPVLARDVRTLRSVVARGLRVRGLRSHVVDVRVLTSDPAHAVLRVVDSRSAYDLVDASGGISAHAAAGPPHPFLLTLVRVGSRWRVAAISPLQDTNRSR